MGEQIARQFHEVYERLAPQFGYETREDTKVFDPQSQNGRLMIAVCAEVIGEIKRERDEAREALRVLFKDYKELADSGDAGFWELEDKEAAQPALRILQQMDATNPTTKSE